MTDDTTPTEPAAAAPAAAEVTPAAAAPLPAQVATRHRGAGWWILVSGAGAGLLIVGLLGGILIGQHTSGPGFGDRAGFNQSTGHGDQSGNSQTPRERMRDRLQDRQRDGQDTDG